MVEERTVLKSIALYAALITLGVVLSPILEPSSAPAQASPLKRTILQRPDVPGTNLELIIATVEIAPRARASPHTHPGLTIASPIGRDSSPHSDRQPERT